MSEPQDRSIHDFAHLNQNPGRKPKLTPEIIETFKKWLKTGGNVEAICTLVKVAPQTFYNWMIRGSKAKSGLYRALFDAVSELMAEQIMSHERIMDAHAKGLSGVPLTDKDGNVIRTASGGVVWKLPPVKSDWRASLAVLERRHSRLWGLKNKVELTGADGGPLKFTVPTQEELEKLKAELENLERTNKFTSS